MYYILKLYQFLTIMIPCLAVYFIYKRKYRENPTTHSSGYLLKIIVFAIYIFGVFDVTGISTIFDIGTYGLEIDSNQINLIPFSRDGSHIGYILNVIMFVPLGFLLPFIWPHMRKFGCIFAWGLGFSLLIEVTQLFNYRQTDVDDLIMNTLGAVIGFIIFKILYRSIGAISGTTGNEQGDGNYMKNEPLVYGFAMFLGRFLLYHPMGLVLI